MDAHSLGQTPNWAMFGRTQTRAFGPVGSQPPDVFLRRADQSMNFETLSEEEQFVKEFKDFCTRYGLRPFSRAVILTHYLLAKTWPESRPSSSGSEDESHRP